jgi:type IV pilus assembly protein PilM
MKLFKRQASSVVGLDIGSHSVKLVQLLHRNGKRQLMSLAEERYAPSPEQNRSAMVTAIGSVFKQADLKPNRGDAIITSVSGPGTAIKQVEFPLLTDEELKSSIKWQAGKRLPFGPDEAVLDYQVLGRDETSKKMNVLLVAVTRKCLADHLELLQEAGIDPPIIDIGPLALANAVMGTQELEEDKAVAVLDMGATNTILDVFAPGEFFFTRDIAVTGRQLTEELQKHGNTSYDEAEQTKIERADTQILEAMKDPLDRLIFEIRRSLTYYENRRGRGGFQKLFLAGGGARLAQLTDRLHSLLGVPVEQFNPLNGIDTARDQVNPPEVAPQLAQAVGLALRRVGK